MEVTPVVEVAPGIHLLRVPIPDNPLGFLNSYLVKTDEGSLLVDTGWNTDEAFGALARQLGEVGVSLADLKYIVITHVHPDHFGLVGRLKQHTQAKIVLHEIERSFLTSRYVNYDDLLAEGEQWLRINGVPDVSRNELNTASLEVLGLVWVAQPDLGVRGGEHLHLGDFDFEVVWTPGHSPGHICLYEKQRRILMAGDHVLPHITPNVSMHSQSFGNPLADFLDSLKAVEQLDVNLVLPAHEEVFTNLPKRIEEILVHHEERKQAIINIIDGTPKNAYEVAGKIRWETMGVSWEDLRPMVRRSAVTETLAHLEQMRSEGALTKTNKDGVILYGLPKS